MVRWKQKKRQIRRRIGDVPHSYLLGIVAKEVWGVKKFLRPERSVRDSANGQLVGWLRLENLIQLVACTATGGNAGHSDSVTCSRPWQGDSRAIKIVQRATSGTLNLREAPKGLQSCA
jgi:hypothetical protein